MTDLQKSLGHLCFHDGKEFYTDSNGNLYIADQNAKFDTGYRIGMFECRSRADNFKEYLRIKFAIELKMEVGRD